MFFTIFPVFFTGAKSFSWPLFSRFSRLVQAFHGDFLGFFHGFDLRFHGRKTKIFHGRDIFFTGRISETKSKKLKIIISIHKIQKIFAKKGTLKKNQGFFTGTFRLFTGTIFEIFHVHKF